MSYCGDWLKHNTTPHLFVRLLYSIGFFGVRRGTELTFRGVGARGSSVPTIDANTHAVVHPCYADALHLQDKIIGELGDDISLQKSGLLIDLPAALSTSEYLRKLEELKERLDNTPEGNDDAAAFEEIVGDIISLCFFRVLTNVKPRERDIDGRVIRDWIASNSAESGFWELVRQEHKATQIVWECKNFSDLEAANFHQAAYYMNPTIGNFCVMCFRGDERKKFHYEHIRRIAQNHNGMILLLTNRDLHTLIRQALHGKAKESHIREIYDTTIRLIG